MDAFRVGHASHPDWREAAGRALAALPRPRAPLPAGQAPLGIVYATPAVAAHLAELLALLRQQTGIDHWAGGIGAGVCAGTTEYSEGAAIVLMLADLPRDGFRVFSGRHPLPAPDTAQAFRDGPPKAALVHADAHTPDLAELVEDLALRVDAGFQFGAIVGGEAGQASMVADDALSGGLSGVAFGPGITLMSRVTQGCAPLAGEHRISDCSAQFIQGLDGRPALDVLLEDLGVDSPARESLDGEEILRALPAERLRGGLLVGLADGAGPRAGFGDYLVRNIVGIDPRNRLLAIAGAPREGDRAVFCTRDPEAARRDLVRICTELRSEIEESGARPRGALLHACVARGEHLFGARGAEIELVRHNLGDVPLVGVYANGEIVRDRVYGYTAVLTIFA